MEPTCPLALTFLPFRALEEVIEGFDVIFSHVQCSRRTQETCWEAPLLVCSTVEYSYGKRPAPSFRPSQQFRLSQGFAVAAGAHSLPITEEVYRDPGRVSSK
jgi:hypothetical protein